MTVEEAKLRCESLAKCQAITFRDSADVKGKVHLYLKEDTTVAEADKTWTSLIKRPAGRIYQLPPVRKGSGSGKRKCQTLSDQDPYKSLILY